MDAIGTIKKNGAFIYTGCDLQVLEPYFVDRTLDVDKHQANINCYDLKSMIAELNSAKPSLIPDVLCPWGESRAGNYQLSASLEVRDTSGIPSLVCLLQIFLGDYA